MDNFYKIDLEGRRWKNKIGLNLFKRFEYNFLNLVCVSVVLMCLGFFVVVVIKGRFYIFKENKV